MIERFTEFIKKHALFNPEDKILLAFSGGVDSVVMVDLFHRANIKFGLAHCNFSLRGRESDIDEDTVKSIAGKYKAPIFTRTFNTTVYAQSRKISIEMAARELRFAFFDEIMDQERYDYLATAHHLGDTLETIILNLTKGTGISGLRGILPKRDRIIRPLLFADKNMILKYAKDNQLRWREDQTNENDVYQRNLIRMQVVRPLLKINPGLFETLSKTTAKLRFTEKIYLDFINDIKKTLIQKKGRDVIIAKAELKNHNDPLILLTEVLKEFGFNFEQCEGITEAMDSVGSIFLSNQYQLNIDREHILISPASLEEKDLLIENFKDSCSFDDETYRYSCRITENKGYKIKVNRESASLDFDLLVFPLLIRKWNPGDWFMPLGMKHKKKLSDFMIDEKIPLNLKRSIKVLVSSNEIVWVVGHRISERFKISNITKNVFEITVREK